MDPDGTTPERLTQHNNEVAYPTPIDARTIGGTSHGIPTGQGRGCGLSM